MCVFFKQSNFYLAGRDKDYKVGYFEREMPYKEVGTKYQPRAF